MAVPGSITIAFRVPEAKALVAVVGIHAGWCVVDAHEPDVLEFSRFVGSRQPDGETQTAHFAHLERSLSEAGYAGLERVSNGVVIGGAITPQRAAGQLFGSERPEQTARFLGTCFAFRQTNIWLTAAHCVAGLEPNSLFVKLSGRTFPVAEVQTHATADLALLDLGSDTWPGGVEPFIEIVEPPWLDGEFIAYGFPEDAQPLDTLENKPIERMFRGFVQRRMLYRRGGFEYVAIEMSIPSPAGLSGGPLFNPAQGSGLLAVAVENVQSTTYVGREVSETEGMLTTKRIETNFVQYGVAVLLAPLAEFLYEQVPLTARLPPAEQLQAS